MNINEGFGRICGRGQVYWNKCRNFGRGERGRAENEAGHEPLGRSGNTAVVALGATRLSSLRYGLVGFLGLFLGAR